MSPFKHKGQPKLVRVQGQRLLLGLDKTLRTLTGAGLDRYLHDQDEPCRTLPISELARLEGYLESQPPVLVVAGDQGGGLFQAWHYLQYKCGVTGLFLSDPNADSSRQGYF